ncbi:cation diffusion facilitator CzcD-associated flavoprotein CzcO [Mycobacterium frederiksbergense]|uniref:Cation diffusion facilitator CzcD-associated flavoprotein CzcO n=1 Tax=Mycolicibacterium frederiksbergense TaxID=117567 RepID=A0ABT6KTZ7_9MYCO|nr:NAD(P)/FAD-dependent oxidoreductase [Mycolicibacterium frederiksbergense]MDH6194157.1 cation diffusion facilitator CzcD-associated flavoprotein CzcO [Mycolicibacterium frederiksbergense]
MATTPQAATCDFDVLIIGAGISGIGAACHLKTRLPGKTFAVLDGRDVIGGTWSLFRYPGIRSDSDMPTFGFGFKPWTDKKTLADGQTIVDYVQEAATENGVDAHIRFGHRVVSADFSSADNRWTVTVHRTDNDETETLTARFLFSGTGYYDYKAGFTPEFAGIGDFAGQVIHPQQWPDDLDYAGKRVVVIGSGATAVTLIPAMADTAGHVTMLQRSPSYVFSLPAEDVIADTLNKLIGPDRAYPIVRRKNIMLGRGLYKACRRFPKLMRMLLMADMRRRLPKHFDVDTHFGPRYNPWEQRLCLVPSGDIFRTLSSGRASVVTDRIERFTKTGIRLQSGQQLDADIVVTATGLNLLPFGGIDFAVDGQPVNLAETTVFRSMMLSGVPNFAFAFGYTNIAWTLKVDLVSEHFCRLIEHMDARGHTNVTPLLDDRTMPRVPMIDMSSGYIQRAIANFPHAGTADPWTLAMAYENDMERLSQGPIESPALRFTTAQSAALAF